MKLPLLSAIMLGGALTATVPVLASPAGQAKDKAKPQPKVYAVADAHLDTQWNWTVQTTIREYLWNTISRNNFLLPHFPDYVFNFEGGQHYAWFKEYYPQEYEKMKDLIKSGRWHISGASWNANDVNVPSVESLVRNIALGQKYYRDEFGVESTDIFLPDCFGFGWTLPTVAKHCGLIGFSSQKLGWREKPFYPDGKKYPFTIGLWQGVDGERIMMAHGYDYGRRFDGKDLSDNEQLKEYVTHSPLNMAYRYYGTGDMGGSPSIPSIVSVEKGLKGNGPLKIVSATSDQLYKDFLPFENHPELPVFDGELLMDVHGTGCYTSQTAMKLYNRQNELLADAAERAAVAAELMTGAPYNTPKFTEAWHRFLWHQFHDDLTGTSIPEAYTFSWNDELLSLKDFSGLLTQAISQLTSGLDTRVSGIPVVMYNPLAYEVATQTEISVPAKTRPSSVTVTDQNGKKVAAQVVGFADGKATIAVNTTVPATGLAVYNVSLGGKGKQAKQAATKTLENSVYAITFDDKGDITSILDKKAGKELVADGKAVRLALFTENESFPWPAWEIIKKTIDADPVSITDNVSVTMVEDGPVRKTAKVTKTYGDSQFTQYVRLYEGPLADRIDFVNEVDWDTQNALLKAEFPLSVANAKATYDLGLGVAERGNNTDIAYEVPAYQWADLTATDGSYGVTFASDSKYGWDKPADNTLRLTLLHTPKTKNGYRYQDKNDLGYHQFTYSIIGHNGALDRATASRKAEKLNQPTLGFIAPRHKGHGRLMSLVSTDADNVTVKAFKKAEDGNGYVVRVYETAGQPVKANIKFAMPIASAQTADGTEKALGAAEFAGNTLAVNLKPNSMATFRVSFDAAKQTEAPKMAHMSLPMNKQAFSYNAVRDAGDFSSGYTYAAELIPSEIVSDGITFKIDPDQLNTVMTAKGDTLQLPEGKWSKLHILAAAATEEGDVKGTFTVGDKATELTVPSYTEFIGQWGHKGQTTGYLKPQKVAYVGTHRHSPNADEPYEFTYLFHYTLDVPEGATSVVLPDNQAIALFAATVADGETPEVVPATPHYLTAIKASDKASGKADPKSILTPEMITAYSGFVDDKEQPKMIVDGNKETKWCDNSHAPAYVDFDLGKPTKINGWKLVNAGAESRGYVTSNCFLQYRNSKNEEWATADGFAGNKANVVNRILPEAVQARYVRLLVAGPTQDSTDTAARIYEFEVY